MDQRRYQRNDYQRQGITMRKSVIAIIVIVLVVLCCHLCRKESDAVSRCVSVKFCATTKSKPLVYAPGLR